MKKESIFILIVYIKVFKSREFKADRIHVSINTSK